MSTSKRFLTGLKIYIPLLIITLVLAKDNTTLFQILNFFSLLISILGQRHLEKRINKKKKEHSCKELNTRENQ